MTAKTYGHDTYLLVDRQSITERQYKVLDKLLKDSKVIIKDLRQYLGNEYTKTYENMFEIYQEKLNKSYQYKNDGSVEEYNDARRQARNIFTNIIDYPRIKILKEGVSHNDVLYVDFDIGLKFPLAMNNCANKDCIRLVYTKSLTAHQKWELIYQLYIVRIMTWHVHV